MYQPPSRKILFDCSNFEANIVLVVKPLNGGRVKRVSIIYKYYKSYETSSINEIFNHSLPPSSPLPIP